MQQHVTNSTYQMSRTKSDKRHSTRVTECHAISHKYCRQNNETQKQQHKIIPVWEMTPCSFVDRQQCAGGASIKKCVPVRRTMQAVGVAKWSHMRRQFTGSQTNANTALCSPADGHTDSTAYWAPQYSPQLHTDCWVLGLPTFPTLIYKCLCPLEPTSNYVPPV
jgi:hypothetical protein